MKALDSIIAISVCVLVLSIGYLLAMYLIDNFYRTPIKVIAMSGLATFLFTTIKIIKNKKK